MLSLQRPAAPMAAAQAGSRRAAAPGRTSTPRAASSSSAATAAPTTAQWRVTDAAVQASFSSVDKADGVETEAEVRGELPSWLVGSYLRNGPGNFDGMQHLFDGYAMLCKVRFDGARCFSSHKFIETEAWKSKRDLGKMRWREFGTAIPSESGLQKAAEYATTILGSMGLTQGVTDNASVNVVPWAPGTALAMTETVAGTYSVRPASLDTVGPFRFKDDLPGQLTTAHPQPDGQGGLLNITSDPVAGFTLYRVAQGSDRREEIARIPHRRPGFPAWVHAFVATPNWAVIPEFPAFFNLLGLMTDTHVDQGAYFIEWKPELGTFYHAVNLRTGERRTFRAPAGFTFHFSNAHESPDGSTLYVDAAEFADLEVVDRLSISGPKVDATKGISPSTLRRIALPLDAVAANGGRVVDIPRGESLVPRPDEALGGFYEFPAINPACRGRPYRYTYGVCAVQPTRFGNALCKVDTTTGATTVWHEDGAIPGEPTFVPRPDGAGEDDGVLVSVITGGDGRAAVVVLDAETMAELARCQLPYELPYGFHGGWFGEV
ncbi:unnamed protein product [Pedinophyceae sp. YPF-701]|nr:unnamed protein product [Pedinophyceae sp. YPF-701]